MCTMQLENKTARILHIGLTGGKALAIPPMETGGIIVEMSDPEKAAFDIAVASEEVQSWITGGALIVTEIADPPPPEAGDAREGIGDPLRPPTEPPPEPPTEPPPVEPPPEVPEHVRRGKRSSRDE